MAPRLLLCGAIRPYGTDAPLDERQLGLGRREVERLGLRAWLGRRVTSAEAHTNAILSNFARGDPQPIVLHTRNPGPAFIAYNLAADATVAEWLSLGELLRLIAAERPAFVGISSLTQEFPKVELMVTAIRSAFPDVRIVLGGYGVVTPQIERLAGQVFAVTREEGVAFFRRLLGEDQARPYRNPPLRISPRMSLLGIPLPVPLRRLLHFDPVFTALGLGCRMRCRFCATSNYWEGYRPLLPSGREAYASMRELARALGSPQPFFWVNEDDFLDHHERNVEILRLNERHGTTAAIGCFSSARAIQEYAPEDLVKLGVDTVFVSLESTRPSAVYNPRKKIDGRGRSIDFAALVATLQEHGVSVFVSTMFGLPGNDFADNLADMEHALALAPTAWQWSVMTPYPGTPLYEELARTGRLLHPEVARPDGDGGRWVEFDGMTPQVRLEGVVPEQLSWLIREAPRRAYLQGGPTLLGRVGVALRGWRTFRRTGDSLLRALAARRAELCSRALPLLLAYQDRELGLDASLREQALDLGRRIVVEVRGARRPTLVDRAAAEIIRLCARRQDDARLRAALSPGRGVVNRSRGPWQWSES
ncbi:MAG: radical SAM protein [Deltaproteobacteria bacterium]|nr:radical SAM protein [Deltaproteobacteria bacterium]